MNPRLLSLFLFVAWTHFIYEGAGTGSDGRKTFFAQNQTHRLLRIIGRQWREWFIGTRKQTFEFLGEVMDTISQRKTVTIGNDVWSWFPWKRLFIYGKNEFFVNIFLCEQTQCSCVSPLWNLFLSLPLIYEEWTTQKKLPQKLSYVAKTRLRMFFARKNTIRKHGARTVMILFLEIVCLGSRQKKQVNVHRTRRKTHSRNETFDLLWWQLKKMRCLEQRISFTRRWNGNTQNHSWEPKEFITGDE